MLIKCAYGDDNKNKKFLIAVNIAQEAPKENTEEVRNFKQKNICIICCRTRIILGFKKFVTYIRFIESFRFLSAYLQNLTVNLSDSIHKN